MTRWPGPRSRSGGVAWGLPALVFVGTFALWPLASIASRAFAPGGEVSFEAVRTVVTDSYYWGRLGFTTGQAAASTALTLAIGLPAAYCFAAIRFPGRAIARAIVTVPFVLPTVVVALAFQRVAGPQGWLNEALGWVGVGPVQALGTVWVILAAHVFYNVAVFVRIVGGVWANLDPALEEAARLLGADRRATFRLVTLPALLPAVLSAAALVFTFTFTSFGVVLILGGPGLDTIEVVIYRLATRLVQLPEAAVLSLVQLTATLAALWLHSLLQRGAATTRTIRPDRAKALAEAGWGGRALLAGVAAVLGLLIVTPLAALLHGAFTIGIEGAPSLANYAALGEDTGRLSFVQPLAAIRWSLLFALGTMLIALPIGFAAATWIARTRGRLALLVDAALMLPLAIPAVVLGLGYLTTFNRDPIDLRGSPWLVLAAHSLVAYPFVLRSVLPVLRGLDPRLPEAARMLGARPLRVWRHIELPLASRGLLVGAVFAFAVSLGEFGATLLLRRREFATMPVAIFEALGRPGAANLGRAFAMATILLVVTAVGFLVIERLRYRDIGEF